MKVRILLFLFEALLLIFFISACKSNKDIFEKRKYYFSNFEMEFYPDNSYLFLDRTHSGYVNEMNKGVWKQVGKDIQLISSIDNAKNLPMKMRKVTSNESDIQIVVNLLPRIIYFDYLPKPIDLVKTEMVVGNKTYPLDQEINILRLQKQSGTAFIRAYPRDTLKVACKLRSDTLISEHFNLDGMDQNVTSIDVDINPINFAQTTRGSQTLRILSARKIRWNKAVYVRPR